MPITINFGADVWEPRAVLVPELIVYLLNLFHNHLYNKQKQVFSWVGYLFIYYVMMNFLSMDTLNDDIA